MGFQGGDEPFGLDWIISTESLKRIAKLDATMRITLYRHKLG
ncbi:hypothetical protein OP10G_0661 [Fimbriimonas ginsengisoli Gsoil 348]|uniref:Uncharacterized protein n=1 Tax=Fimbriimonas ginsengisoli Gsoil 348 TaxID=661478 RepID=A0A068NR25_FIMGI|nr:hypothetical protein OP10G_0661 [Fimbriimonas ginsengisoli Gsoil 348]